MKYVILTFLVLVIFSIEGSTQNSSLTLNESRVSGLSTAKWIWTETSQPNTWIAFRNFILLKEQPDDYFATIAVDSKYWLWINGSLVVREGGLKRTPNPFDTYADTLNLKSYLRKGRNTVAILVWYWGKEGHGHNGSGHGGLLFEGRNKEGKIISDSNWKLKQYDAFDTTLTGTQPYRPLAEFNVVYDARKEMVDWFSEVFDDSNWSRASEYGCAPEKPWGNLISRPISLWKDYGLKDYLNGFPKTSMGNILVMDLPYNAQVTPYFKIKAKAGLSVDVRTDCYTDGGAYNVRAEYITKEGIQEFECPGWMSGEKVWYNFPPQVEIISLKYRESGYNTKFEGAFSCDDQFYNKLWEKARRTLYVNMRDNFMDCPTRERAMWWGDVVIEAQQSYYLFSPDVSLLTRKAIFELINWQTEEGVLYSPIPGPHPPLMFGPHRELPLQSLASIGMYGFWNYYLYTGDSKTLVVAYPAIKRYLSLWKIGADGLVVHRDGKWNWQDWGSNIDVPLLDNCWYYSALDAAKRIAVLANSSEDTLFYEKQMKSIKSSFNKLFWTGNEFRSPKYTGKTDERGNAMAVVTGIASEDKWNKLRQVMNNQLHASPYMEKFVLESLFKIGAGSDALNRLKNRYSEMVESKTSTLSENWDINGFSNSRNHGWSGGALTLLMQYVAGIEPLEPSYTTFSVRPMLGHLKHVEAKVPTPHGIIQIKIDRNKYYSMSLIVPDSTKAFVQLPKELSIKKRLSVNSIYKKDQNSKLGFELHAGEWKIELK